MKRSDNLGENPAATARIGYLDVVRESHAALVTMNRPEKLNAMTAEFWSDLRACLDMLAADGTTRVVIITGAGDRAFSSGGDIVGFTQLKTEAEMRAYQADAMASFSHVEQCPLIVIAAVNGMACGGGCELAMASDIVIAADSAIFGLPEASLGLIPGFGALRGPEVVGRQMTKFLIATGTTISAQRAYEIGLAQLIVPRSELIPQAKALAAKIAERSPNALAVGKKMINSTIDSRAFQYSIEEITMLQSSADRAEGVAAYLARRKPVFGSR